MRTLLGIFLSIVSYSAVAQGPPSTADLGSCALSNGDRLDDCFVTYRAFGELTADRDNAILVPTWFGGESGDWMSYLGADAYIDTTKFFVIIADAFGNGSSSSPSNVDTQQGADFPEVSIRDMVVSQHRLITEHLGLSKLHAIVGISMGGMQAFEWSVAYPDFADLIVPVVGSPRLGAYDLFLWKAMLRSIERHRGSEGSQVRIAAELAPIFQLIGSTTVKVDETPAGAVDTVLVLTERSVATINFDDFAAQLIAMINHDISREFDLDMGTAAGSVTADMLVVYSPDDHVVTPYPAERFARLVNARTLSVPSECGHGVTECEKARIGQEIRAFLERGLKAPEVSQDAVTLKEAYAGAFLIGTAVNKPIVSGADPASQSIVLRHFNTITPENVMKAGPINPEPGVHNFGPADELVAFAETHDLFVVGHTLVWHNQTPDWFFEDVADNPKTPEALAEQMRRHIEAVAGRYAGRVDAWDVVNEVIDNDGSYRPTMWVNGIGRGDELVKLAFQFASEYAPDAELYYNDFNAWRPAKRDGIVRLVRMLQAEGIRIDGVGIQAHWGLDFPKMEYIEAAIDSFAATGVKVMITELDIDVLPLTKEGQIIGSVMSHPQFQLEEFEEFLDPYPDGLPDDVQQELTDRYAELFGLFYRKRDKIDRVTLWGVHDGMSWKNGYPVPDRTNYPLLFDRDRRRKQALEAVLRVPQME